MIYIITLNYNTCADTIDCLNSLEAVSTPHRVIVVDNDSLPEDFNKLKDYLEKSGGMLESENNHELILKSGHVLLIKSSTNLGFSGGNNMGIRIAMSQSDFGGVVLLNNDTLVDSNFLNEIMHLRAENDEAHIIGGRIFYENTRDKVWFDGGMFNKHVGKAIHFNENKMISEIVESTEPKATGFVTGCLMYISPRCLESVGLLDESFFIYSEDLDYCIRAKKLGFGIFVVPTSIIWHKVSSSTGGLLSPTSAYWIIRNRFRIARIHLNRFEQFTSGLYFWVSRIPRFIRWFVEGRRSLIKAQLRGAIDGLKKD